MAKLTYSEEKHWYYIDDIWVPSVTQVIGPLNDFSKVPAHILKNKCDWGSKIDTMIEYYIDGCLNESLLNDSQKRVLEQFYSFLATDGCDFDWDTCITKHRGCNERLKFAGESDHIFPKHAVIDLKTRKLNKLTDPLQLWGYNSIYSPDDKLEHYILSLYEDRYELKEVNKKSTERRQSESRFRYLLDKVWAEIEFKQKIEVWKGEK